MQLEKLNNQLAEAEAALEARKKPPEENGPKIVGEGLVIDEWVCLFKSCGSGSFDDLFVFSLLKNPSCVNHRKNEGKDILHNNRLKWLTQCKLCLSSASTEAMPIIWLQKCAVAFL